MKDFNCRILGTASGMPSLNKSHSAIWVETYDKNLLFDCGEGTCQQLIRYGLDKERLDYIIISHFHPDHISGIFMVLQMLYLQCRTKPLTLYLPERSGEFQNVLTMLYLFPVRFDYELSLKDMDSISTSLPMVKAIQNNHLDGYKSHVAEYNLKNTMLAWSFRIESENSSLLYSSDFRCGLSEKIKEVDYLIVDALHPSYEEIMKLSGKTKKKVVLTHGMSEELNNKLDFNNDKFIIAEDGYLF